MPTSAGFLWSGISERHASTLRRIHRIQRFLQNWLSSSCARAISYAALTPGGLFAPMLVLGAQSGWMFGAAFNRWLPNLVPNATPFAVVGMAAFFTAVVRAPLTGIVLVMEMTNCLPLLLPMLAACGAAMLLPTLLRDPPIYESLLQRTLRA